LTLLLILALAFPGERIANRDITKGRFRIGFNILRKL